MGKRCQCEKLFRRLEEDVRLRTLPMAAQMLWMRLVRLALASPGFDGALRFGSDFGFLVSVSIAVSASETEVETALASLQRRGLVRRGDDGESLILPDVEAAAARSEAARINGLRGGRPRKGETPEAARQRRQGALMLPIGGRPAETQETESESSRAAAKPIGIEDQEASKPREADWVSIGAELAEIAGMDLARGGHNYLPVKGWIEAGASPAVIRDVVRRCAARPGYGGVRSLQYFHRAVMDAVQEARPPAAPSADGYHEALKDWQRNGCPGGAPPSRAEWLAGRAA